MAGLKRYLKQTVALRRVVGHDQFGEPTYSASEALKARKVPAEGRTVNGLGVEVQNRTKLLTKVEVSAGDLIDDAAVTGVEALVDRRGKTVGYRVEQ